MSPRRLAWLILSSHDLPSSSVLSLPLENGYPRGLSRLSRKLTNLFESR